MKNRPKTLMIMAAFIMFSNTAYAELQGIDRWLTGGVLLSIGTGLPLYLYGMNLDDHPKTWVYKMYVNPQTGVLKCTRESVEGYQVSAQLKLLQSGALMIAGACLVMGLITVLAQ